MPNQEEAVERIPEEMVEALARKRWNARRAEIIESGTAAHPGRLWDEIQPRPNGHDVRASAWEQARRDLEDVEPILRSQIERELGERLTSEDAIKAAIGASQRHAQGFDLGEVPLEQLWREGLRAAADAALTTATHEGGDE